MLSSVITFLAGAATCFLVLLVTGARRRRPRSEQRLSVSSPPPVKANHIKVRIGEKVVAVVNKES
jgi:hypothetical protein